MKEATGELNMTLIVVTIVALLSTLFFTVIWPRIHNNFRRSTTCDAAICNCEADGAGGCTNFVNGQPGAIICKYYNENGLNSDSDGRKYDNITCAWKG